MGILQASYHHAHIDFRLLDGNGDTVWKADHREILQESRNRAAESLLQIPAVLRKTDDVVAVFGHSGWIRSALEHLYVDSDA